MKCPRCNEHNLRNKLNKHGKRVRYCKGCNWEKVVVEKLTVEDDLAEIEAKINEMPVVVSSPSPILPPNEAHEPEILTLPTPNAATELEQCMKDAEKEVFKAVGIPAGLMDSMRDSDVSPTAIEIIRAARWGAKKEKASESSLTPAAERVIEKIAKPLPDDKSLLGSMKIPVDITVLPPAEEKPKKRGLMSKVKGLFRKD